MPDSPYTDLSRPPLSQAVLRRAVVRAGALWTDLRVVPRTASTNAGLAAAARDGAAEGVVLVAEHQTAGRGRLGRGWESPPRAGLTVSVLLRPGAPVPARGWSPLPSSRYGWLPLLAGVALADAVRRLGEVDAVLKWPNDLLIDGAKCAGILAEAVPDGGVVIGIGLNVSLGADELPRDDTTSLLLSGSACVDRDPLLRALLRELADGYADWRAAGGDPDRCGLRADYLARCDTLSRRVRVQRPGGDDLDGEAVDVDSDGRLVVSGADTRTPVAAGDIVHVR
ncbi:MAG: biotin--[acetyl-CoA-carboxylase] ligase [Micromonosporaceae bacterium]|nr:biotin--[acetyl-CoA-carboxylase] ligase [Micromonosporaceae bacterium]